MHYSRRDDMTSYNFEKEEILKPNLDMTKTHPQLVNFVNNRAAGFVALQVKLEVDKKKQNNVLCKVMLKMIPDGTKNGLIHAKVLNLKVKAVNKIANEVIEEEGETDLQKKNIIGNTCHPIGPFPKAKLVCVESIGLCRLACRRRFNTE